MNVLRLSFLGLSLIAVGCAPSHDHHHGHHHGHAHSHSPHHGIVKPFASSGKQTGYVELKLHDDKGDLELWLTKDEAGKQPYDLPLDSVINVDFPKLGKTVELQVRNTSKNEDEDGKGNIRAGKTNYFIFPGDTGADPSFLVGKDFASMVVVSFAKSKTDSFELKPHTH